MGCVQAGVSASGGASICRYYGKESPEEQLVRELWDSMAMLEIGFLNSFFSSIDFMQRCEEATESIDDSDKVCHIFLEYGMETEAAFFGNLQWIHVLSRIFELYQSEQTITFDCDPDWCMTEDVFTDYCRDYRRWIPARFILIFEQVDNPIMRAFIQQHRVLPYEDRVVESISQSIHYLTDNFNKKHARSTVLDFVLSSKHHQSKVVLQDFLNFYITSSLAWDICEYMFHLHVCYLATKELCVPLGCYDWNEESSIASNRPASQTLVVDNNPDSDSENDDLILEESVNLENNQIQEQKFCDRLIRSLAPREYNGWQKSRRSICVNTEDSCSDNSSFKESSPRSPSRDWFPKYHPARNANAKRRGHSFPSNYRTNEWEYKEPVENTIQSSFMTQTTVLPNVERSITQPKLRPWETNRTISDFFRETTDEYKRRVSRNSDLKSPVLEQIPGGGAMFSMAYPSTPVSSVKSDQPHVIQPSVGSSPYRAAERLLKAIGARAGNTFPERSVSEPPPTLQSDPKPKVLTKSLTKSHRKETSIFVREILGDWGDAPLIKDGKSISKSNIAIIPRGIDCDDTGSGMLDAKRRCSDEKSGTFSEVRKRIGSLRLYIPRVHGDNTTSSSLEASPKSHTSSLKSHLQSLAAPLPNEDNAHSRDKRLRRSLGGDKIRQIPRTGTSGPTFV